MLIIIAITLWVKNQYDQTVNVNFSQQVYAKDKYDTDEAKRFKKALDGDKPVVVDFYSNWCGSCRMIEPVFNEVKSEYSKKAVFVRVNVDYNPQLANDYDVTVIPMVYVINPQSDDIILLPSNLLLNKRTFEKALDKIIEDFNF